MALQALQQDTRPVKSTVALVNQDIDDVTKETEAIKASGVRLDRMTRSALFAGSWKADGLHILTHGNFNSAEALLSSLAAIGASDAILARAADLSAWRKIVEAQAHPEHEVDVAFVGKYVDPQDSYKSLNEALRHAGIHTSSKVNIHYFDSEELEKNPGLGGLEKMDAILVPGGFGKRGTEGKMRAIRYARENGIPYLGICLGMQLATIEFARNVAALGGANSTEFDPDTPHPVVALITEWLDRTGRIEKRTDKSDLGGTMRLGSQKCPVEPGTLAASIYGAEVNERHRHRYEVNNIYVPQLEAKGYKVSARTPSEKLPEMMELPGHPFFIGVQFHPEFTSTPRDGHPLFKAFVAAALRQRARAQRPGGTLSVVAA